MHNYNIKSVGWQFIFQSKFTAPHKYVHFPRRHNKKRDAKMHRALSFSVLKTNAKCFYETSYQKSDRPQKTDHLHIL